MTTEDKLVKAYERHRDFVLLSVESGRPPRDDWRAALHDAVQDIDRIVQRDAHPDDVMRARWAMGSLAGVWLDVEEGEDLAAGKRVPLTEEQRGEELALLRNLRRAVDRLDALMLFRQNSTPGEASHLGHRVEIGIREWDDLMDAVGDLERFDLDSREAT